MAKFDLPDEGVSFNDMTLEHYNSGPGCEFGAPPKPQHYQDPAREHDQQMDILKQQRERARHE